MTAMRHEWWGELRHGGMLVAPQLLDELLPELPPLDERAYDRLRTAWLKLDAALQGAGAIDEARRAFAGELLEGFLGLTGWQKASSVRDHFKATAVTGEHLRPNWVLPTPDDDGALLAVSFDSSEIVGRGRGVRAHARLVELLRATGVPLGLLTNGRQVRLVHAGPDYDAWAEWDAQTWFDESEGRETLRGLGALARAEADAPDNRLRRLIEAIRESRNRQGDLAQVLGEQVRQGVELLVREVDHVLDRDTALHDALWTDPANGHRLSDDEALGAIYQAATRLVMRLVLVLYAEARDLLPAHIEAYHDSYGTGSLYDTLARADREGRDAMAEHQSAWPRIIGLCRLIYLGSGHAELPVRAYGGQLFRPGNAQAPEPVLRALAALEAARPSDGTVYRLLRLLKVGKVKVRAGRGARWVAGAVDFADLRTEYVGIVYEGLLDYELRRAAADDPIVLLNVGREPALPLSRLRELSAAEIKELLKTFKKDAASAAGAEETDEEAADEEEMDEPEEAEELEDEDQLGEEPTADEAAEAAEEDAREAALAWAREAVEAAGLVRRPRGAKPDLAAFEQRVHERASKLVAGVISPGRLYLVASGGLRKGSGSFYTRPALSVPLAQRALEPLCYEHEGDRLVPRAPEEILALKVCEPAMGSGSFLVAALRYLVEALHRSLEHHGRIQPKAEREVVVTLPVGAPATGEETEELLPLAPEDERFPQMLRSRLARHVVERCLYGVDRNPMAVELARLALWVETLDRDLPFEYLDHKLKVGNSLVGCWLHLVEDYPIRALDREDADGKSGERTKWLKTAFADAKAELPAVIDRMGAPRACSTRSTSPSPTSPHTCATASRRSTTCRATSANRPTVGCSPAMSTRGSSSAWTHGARCGSGRLRTTDCRCPRTGAPSPTRQVGQSSGSAPLSASSTGSSSSPTRSGPTGRGSTPSLAIRRGKSQSPTHWSSSPGTTLSIGPTERRRPSPSSSSSSGRFKGLKSSGAATRAASRRWETWSRPTPIHTTLPSRVEMRENGWPAAGSSRAVNGRTSPTAISPTASRAQPGPVPGAGEIVGRA